jgi:hypothetical protein
MNRDLERMEMKELEALAKIFQDAATRVSEENSRQPRVPTDDSNSPRVNEPEDEVPDLCTSAKARKIAEQMSKTPRVDAGWSRPMEVQYERTAPRYQTRQQRRLNGSVTTDALLSVIELSQSKLTPKQLSSRKFPLEFLCEFANAVMDEETGDMLEYRQLLKRPKYRDIWSKAFGKEIGRLAQGQKGIVEGTDCIFFIPSDDVPP